MMMKTKVKRARQAEEETERPIELLSPRKDVNTCT